MNDELSRVPYWEKIEPILIQMRDWMFDNAFVVGNALQVLFIILAFGVARMAAPLLISRAEAWTEKSASAGRIVGPAMAGIRLLALPVSWLAILWIAGSVADFTETPRHVIRAGVSLLTAWVIIRLASSLVSKSVWSNVVGVMAWSVAALNILGLLDDTIEFLGSMAIQMGDFELSLLTVVKGGISLALFLWLANVASRLLDRRISAAQNLTPSMRVLFGKLGRLSVYAVAIVLALNSVGIDLTAFAVFSGAVGLGIGFGLQKVVSNLISGIILLLDKSVKPGDVIAIGKTYGTINSLGARCVSVITRDGTEHLIPNEGLIAQEVENWTYSNKLVRQKIMIGISYESDVHLAMDLMKAAASESPRVLKSPPPVVQLSEFGASSVDLELRLWIGDPENGVSNIKSEIRLRLWDSFGENGIVFPYPQQDLHLKSAVPLRVDTTPVKADPKE